jgi:hypothetical protein
MTLGELRGPSQQQSRISGPIRRVTTPPHGGSTQRLDGDRSLPAIACPKPDTQVLARCPLRGHSLPVARRRAGCEVRRSPKADLVPTPELMLLALSNRGV